MRSEIIPYNTLTSFNAAAAIAEGWVLAACGLREDGKPRVQLHKLDMPPGGQPPFAEDHDVWAHVVARARSGLRLHREALWRIDSIERACIEIAFGPV